MYVGCLSGVINDDDDDIAEIKSLRDVAMATNFETILAAYGL